MSGITDMNYVNWRRKIGFWKFPMPILESKCIM